MPHVYLRFRMVFRRTQPDFTLDTLKGFFVNYRFMTAGYMVHRQLTAIDRFSLIDMIGTEGLLQKHFTDVFFVAKDNGEQRFST